MTKKERVIAAINHKEVDVVPCGFSLHFEETVAFGEKGVQSHVDFFKETDTDILKIMNENLVPSYGRFICAADYNKVPEITMDLDFMNDQMELTKSILALCDKSAFTMGTVHGILASAIHPLEKSGMSYEEARDFFLASLREDSKVVLAAMQRITDGMCDLVKAYIAAGVDSIYYAALGGEMRYFSDEEFAKWIAPFDRQILKAIKDAGGYSFLHICKDGLNMKRYASYGQYTDVVNWGVYEAPCSLEEGRELFKDVAIMGGLKNRSGVLVSGTDEEITKEVTTVVSQFGKKGFILGADCTLATEQDLHKLKVAISACRACV